MFKYCGQTSETRSILTYILVPCLAPQTYVVLYRIHNIHLNETDLSSFIHRISTQTDMSMQTQSRIEWRPCQMKHSLKRFVLIMSEFSKLKVQMLCMIDRWCQRLERRAPSHWWTQHFLIQTGSGAAASTRVPSFAGSETEREAEPANTHGPDQKGGIIELQRAGRAGRDLSTQRAETFNPPNMIQSSLSRCNTYVIEDQNTLLITRRRVVVTFNTNNYTFNI